MSTCPFKGNRMTLPRRMERLSIDERGYVIPWFVAYHEGKPEFRAMDPEKWLFAVQFKRCWVCGQPLGRLMTFVAGPMCGLNRTSSEPPSHFDCAVWSAQNCPFLSNPDAVRRVDDLVKNYADNVAGFMIGRNPGVTMLWTCRDYSVFDDGSHKPLITMGEPSDPLVWYCEGRIATREEVEASIASGLPNLETAARSQAGGLAHLEELKQRFAKLLRDSQMRRGNEQRIDA